MAMQIKAKPWRHFAASEKEKGEREREREGASATGSSRCSAMTVVNVATLDCGQDDSTADSSRMAMNPHCLFKNYSIMGAARWRMLSFIKMQFQGAQQQLQLQQQQHFIQIVAAAHTKV